MALRALTSIEDDDPPGVLDAWEADFADALVDAIRGSGASLELARDAALAAIYTRRVVYGDPIGGRARSVVDHYYKYWLRRSRQRRSVSRGESPAADEEASASRRDP